MLSFILALFLSVFSQLVLPPNPFITDIFCADPSAHVWPDGRLYLYPSHDIAPPRGCDLMDKYHVFSTDDLLTWTDHGQIIEAAQIEWGRPEGGFMWAPDAIYRDGSYYFYFPHPSGTDWGSTWKIGVAISKEPTANFVPVGYIPNLPSVFDPCPFIDDDGTAYLYIGGAGQCYCGKLGDDMVSIIGDMQPVNGLESFHEGPFLFKKDGIYYLLYGDNTTPNNYQRYATATSALGPWTTKGVVLGDTGCDTSQGSIVQFQGEWLLFYHSQAVSGTGLLRSPNVAKVNFTADGEIVRFNPIIPPPPQNEPAPTQTGTTYTATQATLGGSCVIETSPQGVQAISQLHIVGNYAIFPNVDGGRGGATLLYIRFSSNDGAAFLKVKVNGVYTDEPFIGHASGGWDSYTGYSHINVELQPGANEIYLEGGYGGLNVANLIVIPA